MAALLARGDEVVPVSRGKATVGGVPAVRWDVASGPFPEAATDGVDAVVNLAGASVGEGRWTAARKGILQGSRVLTTTAVADALARGVGPRVLVSGSATGYYGNRGDEVLDESATAGDDFLADTAVRWEAAARRAEAGGVRVCLSRTGMVLSRHGGVLPRLARLARTGVVGPIGGGRQWVPWVHVDDVVGMILAALDDDAWTGPFNAVAPEATRQGDVAKALGRVLGRPAVARTPAFVLKASMGEMAALVLDGQRTVPRVATASGYRWAFADLDHALRAEMGV